MARARLSLAFLAAVGTPGAIALAALYGCPAPGLKPIDAICTPGAYVFCRCENRLEGTKLCLEKGNAFAKCGCGEDGQKPPLIPNGNAGFEGVDAATAPASGPPIDAKCAGKLAVIASTDQEDSADPQAPLYLYGAAYGGKGAWTVARSTGAALRAPPRGGLVGTTLIAVWLTRSSRVAWTKFEANQKTLAPPDAIGVVTTDKAPGFVGGPATGRLYSLAADNTLKEGVYSAAAAWDDGNAPVTTGASEVAGKGAPAAALVGSSYVIAYTAADKSVVVQTQTSGSWSTPVPIRDALASVEVPVALINLLGGTDDLMLVYVGADHVIHSTTRKADVWSAPAAVDPTAIPDGTPSVAPMSKGRAMLVWKVAGGTVISSLYEPSKTPPWSTPASLFRDGPNATRPPTVNTGLCASEATTTYLDDAGKVNLSLFVEGKWTGPFIVPGMTKMTFAGAAEAP